MDWRATYAGIWLAYYDSDKCRAHVCAGELRLGRHPAWNRCQVKALVICENCPLLRGKPGSGQNLEKREGSMGGWPAREAPEFREN